MDTAVSAAIEQFVRGTLRCHCPDEVFRSISVETSSPAVTGAGELRLSIGERLLIYVVAVRSDTTAAGWIERLVAAGVSARTCTCSPRTSCRRRCGRRSRPERPDGWQTTVLTRTGDSRIMDPGVGSSPTPRRSP